MEFTDLAGVEAVFGGAHVLLPAVGSRPDAGW
jgi:hypothetical protein